MRRDPTPGLVSITADGPPAMAVSDDGEARPCACAPPLVVHAQLSGPLHAPYHEAAGLRARLLRRRDELLQEAEREADRTRQESELRVKDEELRRREELDRQSEHMRAEWRDQERRLAQLPDGLRVNA